MEEEVEDIEEEEEEEKVIEEQEATEEEEEEAGEEEEKIFGFLPLMFFNLLKLRFFFYLEKYDHILSKLLAY